MIAFCPVRPSWSTLLRLRGHASREPVVLQRLYLGGVFAVAAGKPPEAHGRRTARVVTRQTVADGWDVLDNNLLACPRPHLEAVLDLLARQPCPARFTDVLEAARVTPEIARRLVAAGFDVASNTRLA